MDNAIRFNVIEMSSIGRLIIQACNLGFAMHNRVMNLLGRGVIKNLSTEDLVRGKDDLVLVDVRSPSERGVSMIPGAITAEHYESTRDQYADKTVVPYCTVGGRSYLYSRKLARQGIITLNYRASILGWCQAGLPLQSPDGEATQRVHPYWNLFPLPDNYEAVKR